MREKVRIKNRKLLLLPGIGLAYFLFVRLTGWSIPCVFRTLTGYRCPGCGITTMFICLASGDLAAAKDANAFLFYSLPLWTVAFIRLLIRPAERKHTAVKTILILIYILSLITFGVLRNML